MAKNTLKLVTPASADPTAPPRQLGEHGMLLWQSVMAEYGIQDSGGREMLAQACAALDRAEECALHVQRDGVTVRTKHGPKENPLLKAELANRSFIVRTLGRLGLDVEAIKPMGRPAGLGYA
jgi:hypothetical protein